MTPANFRAIRKKRGQTQAALAAILRVTARQVQMIEAGDRKANGPITVIMEMLDAGRL